MKVYELIKKLEQFDQDDEVMVLGVQEKNYEILDVENTAFGGRVVDLFINEVIDDS